MVICSFGSSADPINADYQAQCILALPVNLCGECVRLLSVDRSMNPLRLEDVVVRIKTESLIDLLVLERVRQTRLQVE
jgi:hypothetical protein